MVYHEPMKKLLHVLHLILFPVLYALATLIFVLPVQAQVKLDLLPEELVQFQTLGYIKRTQLAFDTSARHIQAQIHPIHIENQGEVQFKADNGDGGKVFVETRQNNGFTSIDKQRMLTLTCCKKLYHEQLSFTPRD